MSLRTMLAPTSASIQKEYVEKQQRLLHKTNDAKTSAVQKVVENLMRVHNRTGNWHDYYVKISKALQQAALTINLDAGKWFLKKNDFPTYSTMYERGVDKTTGKMVLKGDAINPAITRAAADDMITLPEEWANAHPFSQRKRLYNALNATGATKQEALTKTKASKLTPMVVNANGGGISTKNSAFKPKAKQVFAALNYGYRPHGSTTYYGFSHLILKPDLNRKAIYYPEDTFYLAQGGHGTKSQAAFHTIGALLQFANGDILEEIWNSCIDKMLPLPDTSKGKLLIEGHLFQTIKVNRDVQALWLSRQNLSDDPPWTNQEWATIEKNAQEWCSRNAVTLLKASP